MHDINNIQNFKKSLIKHINELYDPNQPWDIKYFPECGRGMVATRDINENEIIVYDKPLLLGPSGNNNVLLCVNCYKIMNEANVCNMCHLTICINCNNKEEHAVECNLISNWKPKKLSVSPIVSLLTPIRGFLLTDEQKELVDLMENHDFEQTEKELTRVIETFENFPKDEKNLKFLKKIISVLNTNAFASVSGNENSQYKSDINSNKIDDPIAIKFISLRGLYPLAAVFNHNCVPNIRYTYDSRNIMTVRATRFIKKDEELFNSYSKLLWGTPYRQLFLNLTKNFKCSCNRCADPTVSILNIKTHIINYIHVNLQSPKIDIFS